MFGGQNTGSRSQERKGRRGTGERKLGLRTLTLVAAGLGPSLYSPELSLILVSRKHSLGAFYRHTTILKFLSTHMYA